MEQKTSFYRFPAMAKLDEWNNAQQMDCIKRERCEADEVLDILETVRSCSTPEDIALLRHNYGMELMDIIHATETALRMEFSDEEVEQLRLDVIEKNSRRNYYQKD